MQQGREGGWGGGRALQQVGEKPEIMMWGNGEHTLDPGRSRNIQKEVLRTTRRMHVRCGGLKGVKCAFAGVHSESVQLACRCPEVAAASTQLLPRPPHCHLRAGLLPGGGGKARPPPSPGSTTRGRGRSAASTGAGPGHGRRRPGYSPGLGARATWIMRGVGFRPGGDRMQPRSSEQGPPG